jgi:hypothetical protein
MNYMLYNDVNIVQDFKLRRLRWASHLHRMGNEKMPKKILGGKFYDKRPAGRLRGKWEDAVRRDVSQILGIRGRRRKAEDREEWRRRLKEAKAQYGAVAPS